MSTKKEKIKEPIRAYSSLDFKEEQVTTFKPGKDISLEETNRYYTDDKGKQHKIYRIRRSTRNYYTSDYHRKLQPAKS